MVSRTLWAPIFRGIQVDPIGERTGTASFPCLFKKEASDDMLAHGSQKQECRQE
jgi:hypothetical protein